MYCIILSAHFVKKKKKHFEIKHYWPLFTISASRVIRTHVFTSAEIESFTLRHRLRNWKMERNWSFQRLVGGQCGQDPRSTKVQDLVPLLTCNKDISRHKSSLGLMTGSGVDTEVELILARSSILSFPSNISEMDICPAHRSSLGIGWRRGLARCRIPAQLSKHVRKSRTTERGISKDISRLILRITGIFLPVGSGKCPIEYNLWTAVLH